MGGSYSRRTNVSVQIKNGNLCLSAKREIYGPHVTIHTLAIDDRTVQVTEVEFGRRILHTNLDTSDNLKIEEFRSDWSRYWRPKLTTDYTSVDDFFSFTIVTSPSWMPRTLIRVTEKAGTNIDIHNKIYKILYFINFGGSSEVYKAKDLETDRCVAFKKVFLDDEINTQKLRGEINLLKRLENPRIVCLYDFTEIETEWKTKILIEVLELGDVDLWSFLVNPENHFSGKMIKDLWRQMLLAVSVVHKAGVLHLDLKPQNFILVAGQIKLIDFGLSLSVPNTKTLQTSRPSRCGTWVYASPESVTLSPKGGFQVSDKSDVWSLGVSLYFMVHQELPYDVPSSETEIVYYPLEFPTDVGNNDPEVTKVLKSCLQLDPAKRPSVEQLLRHRYLRG